MKKIMINWDELISESINPTAPKVFRDFLQALATPQRGDKFLWVVHHSLRERMDQTLDRPLVKRLVEKAAMVEKLGEKNFYDAFYDELYKLKRYLAESILGTDDDFLEDVNNFTLFIRNYFTQEAKEWMAQYVKQLSHEQEESIG